jgi:hypothetical protein
VERSECIADVHVFEQSSWLVLAIVATFFLAGAVKGLTGMGLPTVAMGVLGALMAPVLAAALLIVPSFVTNVWQLFAGPAVIALAKRLWLMMLGIIIGTLPGSAVLARADARWTTAGLGAALIVYAGFALLLKQLSVPKRFEWWLSPSVGLMTGAITGVTGVFVIPAVPYLQALALGRDELVQSLGLSFTISTIALAVGLAWHAAFQIENVTMSMLAVAPALAGMWLGQTIRRSMDPQIFRRWFLVCLSLLGAELVLRTVC